MYLCVLLSGGQQQVDELSQRGLHEDAINLYSLCASDGSPDLVKGVDIEKLHETCADALILKGDFDKAVKHYIDGSVDFVSVMRHFPDLVPSSLHETFAIRTKESPPMQGQVLQRAAAAVVRFCDYHRTKVSFRRI
jgi:hypothetical protein